MRFTFTVLSGLLLGLAACSQSAQTRPAALEDISWANDGETYEVLTLRPNHSYVIVDPRQQGNRNQTRQSGHYDVLSPEYGVILLDMKTPVRLSCMSGDERPYRFAAFAFTPSAMIPPGQAGAYVHLVDQYFAPKASLQSRPGEEPVGQWLK